MITDTIKNKIEPLSDAFRIAAIVQDDPAFIFPCLVRMSAAAAKLPDGIHADSAIGPLRTCRINYDQLQKMADCPEVLSFTFR